MASVDDHKTWFPYMNGKGCSEGFCTFYCPQWCYIYPPPPPFEFPEDNSNGSFSPLVIVIIGVLASAFLLVSYYTLISKYCGNMDSSQTQNHDDQDEELEENHNPSLHEPWQAVTTGLDEALIKTITVCKYKKGDGLVEVTDCSVCLSEFDEDENIRLLPKCSHAFHLPCIDTWLKSHSNCPLCRANIFCSNTSSLQLSTPVIEIPSRIEDISETHNENEVSSVGRDHDMSVIQEGIPTDYCSVVPKPALRVFSDLGNSHGRDTIIEIKNEGYNAMIRRSISMDHSLQTQNSLSVADILQMNQDDEDTHVQDQYSTEVGSSKQSPGETSRSEYKRRVLHRVLSPIAMKRSFSGGRFLLSTHGRDQQQATVPV